ncbi:U-box domain-containing protein 26-like [Selaginella moellendorffii]|nr:U-box domain-containing protein 26-like [Selaginella moellendorffii]|eukprot:XP_024516759.1 U-box domain-containing protein 26-like [Selaginella moellendorffii]
MKLRRHHPRLKYVKPAQIFSCGMFGACSDVVLSPCTPSPAVPQDRSSSSASSVATTTIASSCSDDKENRVAAEAAERQECNRRFQRVPSSTQWELALKLHNRSVRGNAGSRYLATIDVISPRVESPRVRIQELGCLEKHQQPRSLEDLVREVISSRCCSSQALRSLSSLAVSSRNRQTMVKMGLHSELVAFLVSDEGNDIDKSAEVLDVVFSLLVTLSSSSDLVLEAIARAPGISSVLERLLRTGPSSSKVAATTLVVMLSAVSQSEEQQVDTLDAGSFLEAVVGLLSEREEQLVKCGVKALLALCLSKDNRVAAVKAGVVASLLELLTEAKGVTSERMLATLELLSTTLEGRAAILRHALAIPLLLSMILRVSDRGTEYAAGVLCSVICTETSTPLDSNEEALEMAFQARASTSLLLLLQSHCTQRARRKAVKLLKVLHSYGERKVGSAAAECDTAAAAKVVQG